MLRDYLYDLSRDDNIGFFYRHDFYNEIASLQPEKCTEYAEHMIKRIQNNVRNNDKMREWVTVITLLFTPAWFSLTILSIAP